VPVHIGAYLHPLSERERKWAGSEEGGEKGERWKDVIIIYPTP